MSRTERIAFGLLAAALLVTAWTSYDFYHPDEHFQILEFGGAKLGIVPVTSLPWEYAAGIRPWLQPVLFAGLCKALQGIGIEDRFLWTFLFRLFSAACGFYAMLCVYRLGKIWFVNEENRRRHLWICTTLCFMPFLLVRTSSENLSASFFVIGAALLLGNYHPADSTLGRIPVSTWLASGILLGLAFQFRFQIVLMIGGLGLWLLIAAREKWKNLLVFFFGFLIVFGLGLWVDYYGNGRWTFSFYNYFKVNLLQGKAASFGTDPFYAYPLMLINNIFLPFAVVLLASLAVLWIRKVRHPLTWITLPFFLVHCMIGHKEIRFLFPLIPLAILAIHVAFFENGRTVLPSLLRTRFFRYIYRWGWAYNFFLLVVLCIYPFGYDFNINQQRYIFEHRNSVARYYAVGFHPYHLKELTFSFYRPDNVKVVEVTNLSVMASIAEKNPDREIYFFSPAPYLENWPESLQQRTEIENPSHFFFRWKWLVNTSSPILKRIFESVEDAECPTLFKISPVR